MAAHEEDELGLADHVVQPYRLGISSARIQLVSFSKLTEQKIRRVYYVRPWTVVTLDEHDGGWRVVSGHPLNILQMRHAAQLLAIVVTGLEFHDTIAYRIVDDVGLDARGHVVAVDKELGEHACARLLMLLLALVCQYHHVAFSGRFFLVCFFHGPCAAVFYTRKAGAAGAAGTAWTAGKVGTGGENGESAGNG